MNDQQILSLTITGSKKCKIRWMGRIWNLPQDSGVAKEIKCDIDHGIGTVNVESLETDTAHYAYNTLVYNTACTHPNTTISNEGVGTVTINGITATWTPKDIKPATFGYDSRELDV